MSTVSHCQPLGVVCQDCGWDLLQRLMVHVYCFTLSASGGGCQDCGWDLLQRLMVHVCCFTLSASGCGLPGLWLGSITEVDGPCLLFHTVSLWVVVCQDCGWDLLQRLMVHVCCFTLSASGCGLPGLWLGSVTGDDGPGPLFQHTGTF